MFFTLPSDPGPDSPDLLRVVIETPKNSANRYEFDHALRLFRLSAALFSPIHYPGDYGFVPGTLAEDGFALDVLVLLADPCFPGCVIEVRPVGLLNLMDGQVLDQKVLAVPTKNPRFTQIESSEDLIPHIRREIEHFFEIYKELEGVKMQVSGWGGPQDARDAVTRTRERFLTHIEQLAMP